MTDPATVAKGLEELAAHHERQGIAFAKKALNNAPWYHGHAQDTRRAADHFAVAAAVRNLLEKEQ